MALMGSFVPISALLLCLTLTAMQAWLTRCRCDRASYLWVGLSLLGFIAAIFGAIAIGSLLIALFRLDILQNGLHGGIAAIAIVLSFGVLMTLSQWLILRQQVRRPMVQAFLNVLLAIPAWLFLASKILEYGDTSFGLPLFGVLSVGLGAGIGGILHKILNG